MKQLKRKCKKTQKKPHKKKKTQPNPPPQKKTKKKKQPTQKKETLQNQFRAVRCLAPALAEGQLWLWCFHLCLAALSYEVTLLFNLSEKSISSQQTSVV